MMKNPLEDADEVFITYENKESNVTEFND